MNKLILGDCLDVLKTLENNSVDAIVTDPPYGISFMNKHWDYDVPTIDVWREVLRVLKPGGHLLSFGGTRTYHRMVVNIEDAGFEIRDQIQWIYGSGFPKSLNIGKAIDELQGNKRELIKTIKKMPSATGNIVAYGYRESYEGKTTMDITTGNSIGEGWGTALKPANEPICLARKPLSENTVALNVLKWGTGGINIDGCRVETEDDMARSNGGVDVLSWGGSYGEGKNTAQRRKEQGLSPQGRFPANVIHDGSDEVLSQFPNTKSGLMKQNIEGGKFNVYGKQYPRNVETIGDSGSAARFFYCAKASSSERNFGLENFNKQITNDGRNKSIDNAFLRAETQRRNNHPTVKPISLMQYLCRLTTPKNGIVLDPYMGSGTTGIACKLENFSFIGIEKEEQYYKIAEARISTYKPNTIIRTKHNKSNTSLQPLF